MDTPAQIDFAVRLHHAGRFDAAADIYRQILTVQPDHPGALSGLGMIEFQHQRFDAAVHLLERVVGVTGEHPGFLMNLGAVHDGACNWEEAARCYARAIASAPHYPDPYYNLGVLHLRLGRPEAAIDVFDRCMAAIGREFHALAYKAHALADAGRPDEANYLLDHDRYVRLQPFDPPQGFQHIEAFDAAVAQHIRDHPTLRANVLSTINGRHTGELLREPKGPMAAMEPCLEQAVRSYLEGLPDDPEHPVVKWAPRQWKLTSWGVVMSNGGHERSHIHPNGWISGVFYVDLPGLIFQADRGHEGWLRFGEPSPELRIRSNPVLRDYQPGYGRIILFPSYFYHGTVPFRTEATRICVSFDVEPAYDESER